MVGCSKTEPREALERYLLEEAHLGSFGWTFYAVEQKSSSLYAYIISPSSGQRMAPVESELRRVCPDSKLHDFWKDTQLESFELVLMKNVDSNRGKARRLVQLTCDSSFDLIAFEASPTEPSQKETSASKQTQQAEFNNTPSNTPLLKVSQAGNAVFETEASGTKSVAFSDDGTRIAYGSYNKIYIIDAKTEQPTRVLEGSLGDITEIAFAGDRLVATGGKYLGIWNSNTGEVLKIIERDEYTFKFSISKQTQTVYVGKNFVEAWNMQTGEPYMKTSAFAKSAESMALSPDGEKFLVSPEFGSSILDFDAKTGKQTDEIKEISRASQMIFHPDGKSFFIKQIGSKLKQVNLKGEILNEIGPNTVFGQLSLSSNDNFLLLPTWSTLRETEKVIVYDLERNAISGTFDVSKEAIYEAKMAPDEKTIVAATKDNLLHFIAFKN